MAHRRGRNEIEGNLGAIGCRRLLSAGIAIVRSGIIAAPVLMSAVVMCLSLTVTDLSLAEAPAYNIRELQYSDAASDWKSPHYGEIVKCVGGVVTHKFKQRFALQDPALGSEWAAIEVRGYPVYPTGIEVGDQVDFDSVYVDEYKGVTVLQYYNASSHTVNSHGNPLPEPVSISVWPIRYPA